MEKTKQTYVLHLLEKYHSIIASFDLWMSKGAYDVFALIIFFWGFDYMPKHVILGLFEASKTT